MPLQKKRFSKSTRKASSKKSTVALVKRVVNNMTETKANIVSQTENTTFGTTLSSPADWYSLNNLNKGTESHQRVGDKISSIFVDIRGSLLAKGNLQQYHKVMIIQMNKQSDPLQDLLEDNTGGFTPANRKLESIYARVNTTKYRVLGTRVMKTGTSNGGNAPSLTQMFHFKIPLKGTMEFQEDEAICQKKRIAIICFSRDADNSNGSTAVEWSFNSKFYYKDM